VKRRVFLPPRIFTAGRCRRCFLTSATCTLLSVTAKLVTITLHSRLGLCSLVDFGKNNPLIGDQMTLRDGLLCLRLFFRAHRVATALSNFMLRFMAASRLEHQRSHVPTSFPRACERGRLTTALTARLDAWPNRPGQHSSITLIRIYKTEYLPP
jgi:hypothetical protein